MTSEQTPDEIAQDTRIAAYLEGEPTPAELAARERFLVREAVLRALHASYKEVQAARRLVTEAETRQRVAVKTALEHGVSAVEVAEHLGVSRARVYQIRDGRR